MDRSEDCAAWLDAVPLGPWKAWKRIEAAAAAPAQPF